MTIQQYSQDYENAHQAILERMEHAKRKHPEELALMERFETVRDELCEVWVELLQGDYEKAMSEYRDVGTTLYRAMEELQRKTGVRIR